MQRVRSEMGHVVTNASAISVMANNDGDITLTGRVLSSELDALLSTINKVPGVNQIINRLDAPDTPEAVAGGDAGEEKAPGGGGKGTGSRILTSFFSSVRPDPQVAPWLVAPPPGVCRHDAAPADHPHEQGGRR